MEYHAHSTREEGFFLHILEEAFRNAPASTEYRVVCMMKQNNYWKDLLGEVNAHENILCEEVAWFEDHMEQMSCRQSNGVGLASSYIAHEYSTTSPSQVGQWIAGCFQHATKRADASLLVLTVHTQLDTYLLKIVGMPVLTQEHFSEEAEPSNCWQEFEDVVRGFDSWKSCTDVIQHARNSTSAKTIAEALGLDSCLIYCSFIADLNPFDVLRRLLLVSDSLKQSKSSPIVRSRRTDSLLSKLYRLIVQRESNAREKK